MPILWVLVVVLLVVAFAGAPVWPYSQGYGWYPSGGVGLLLVILLLLLLFRGSG